MRIAKISRAAGVALLFVGLVSAEGAAMAQANGPSTAQTNAQVSGQVPSNPAPGENVMYIRTGPGPLDPGDAMDFIGFEAGLGGKVVTGAPFTATISVQRTQMLADGNEIKRTTTGTIARDSQGRVRRDMTLPAIGAWATTSQRAPHVIIINDVVSGTQYILEPDRKIAHEVRPFRGRRRIRIETNLAQRGDAGNVKTTSLGTQTINGVLAQGTRYTRTIPAGAIGNEKPIVITTERWYSPDLRMYVLTKTTDPMRGNSVRQLANIQMGEPAASLFQVPSDYAVQKGAVLRVRRRRRLGAAPPLPPPPPPDDAPEMAPPQN